MLSSVNPASHIISLADHKHHNLGMSKGTHIHMSAKRRPEEPTTSTARARAPLHALQRREPSRASMERLVANARSSPKTRTWPEGALGAALPETRPRDQATRGRERLSLPARMRSIFTVRTAELKAGANSTNHGRGEAPAPTSRMRVGLRSIQPGCAPPFPGSAPGACPRDSTRRSMVVPHANAPHAPSFSRSCQKTVPHG